MGWNFILTVVLLPSAILPVLCFRTYTKEDVLRLREEVREMFQHAYDGYLKHAGDYDELRPLSCDGVDTWGSYSLTLIDALDTLAVMGNYTEFQRVVNILTKKTNFDADINVSVFETNIRIVGGLLGAHLMSLRAGVELEPGWPCNGPLLRLAEDVAKRLLPAFNTKTGMPYGTVNLRHGVPAGETPVTCTAGVGTFIIEFGALSRLTGDPIYEEVALNALYALWRHRSPIGLFGNHIDVQTGRWTAQDAGIGAGVDSYYEYLVKGALMLNRPELLEMFHTGRKAIDKYLKRDDWHIWVSMNKGQVTLPVFQSLEAYWPGVLSLIGDIAPAMKTLHNYHSVWKQYGFLPEFYNIPSAEAGANRENYPLRPELIESAMYLYRATSDPYLLEVGEDMLRSIEYSAKTPCGYATIKNVRDHRKEDRMESFFLAETTKYLYLLFDPDNFLHNDGHEGTLHETPNGICVIHAGGYIFNTEAHPIDPSALQCCHDNSDWLKDFKIQKFIGQELKRKDTEIKSVCDSQIPNDLNVENLTIEIETTVDSDEMRQKMIEDIINTLKKIENETLKGSVEPINETEIKFEKLNVSTSETNDEIQQAVMSQEVLERIIKIILPLHTRDSRENLMNEEKKMSDILTLLETIVKDYIVMKNTTLEQLIKETNDPGLDPTTEESKKYFAQMSKKYQDIVYYEFVAYLFSLLYNLQKRHIEDRPQNVAKAAAESIYFLASGFSEKAVEGKHPEIMEIFRKAQENYEKLLVKKNHSMAIVEYASLLPRPQPLDTKEMIKIVRILELVRSRRRSFEKQYAEIARGPLRLNLFKTPYKFLTEMLDTVFKTSKESKGDGKKAFASSSQSDDIILVDRSVKLPEKNNASSDKSKSQSHIGDASSNSENKNKVNEEPDIGKGSVEEITVGSEDESLVQLVSDTKYHSSTENASKLVFEQRDTPPKIDENANNSLLNDFVQTLLKSTLPAKVKFEPQLLLEKIRSNGIYQNQPQNFELLTCRAQPFLQRVSINGEFF